MSFRLKAAIIAAFSLSATAAVTAADMSSASEAAPSVLSLPGSNALNAAPAGAQPAVTFAAPRQVLQPLAPLSDSADVKPDNTAPLLDAPAAPAALPADTPPQPRPLSFPTTPQTPPTPFTVPPPP